MEQFFAIRISTLVNFFWSQIPQKRTITTMGKRKLGALEKVDADLYGYSVSICSERR